ncbi:alpha/beta fold hydrolase [Ruegeria sp. 6PALISEP08]|uniref:alpha/beta fold hydrolase n=1 Tax=Ruegeria sp. 6PALISEP08 TaxID=1225660 RepID=UPI00067EF80E|nr:alpha/beta hydrolase [Ruegeria sp. 6PALISEP08]
MTPLVLVHGFMGGSAQWDGCRDTLHQHADVIAIDLPGFGVNAHLPPIDSIGGYADWVVRHLRGLGVEEYHLLGHSMGGMIAQEIAVREGERIDRLVLYATGAAGVLPGRFETIEHSKKRAAESGPAATARRIAATWFLDCEAAPGYEHCAGIATQAKLAAINAGLEAMQSWSGEQNLSRIRRETLVLWGDRDRTYPWSQIQMLWEAIPNTSLGVVPGCAHALHAEKPDLFLRLISDFLDR